MRHLASVSTAMAQTNPAPKLSEESLASFGCPPALAKKLLAIWFREARDSEEECLDDFLEAKWFRLAERISSKEVTKQSPLYGVVVQEIRWLKVACVCILKMDMS